MTHEQALARAEELQREYIAARMAVMETGAAATAVNAAGLAVLAEALIEAAGYGAAARRTAA